jgi:outer membrane cobalamin receptor
MWVWFLTGFLCLFTINSHADSTPSTQLNEVDVIGKLDQARDSIQPSLGATDYSIGTAQIDDQSEGDNASFNQVILRTPGAAQDSFGQLHIRGEHANLQYRIDGVVLPEGITGFGQELDTRFIQSVSLIDGSLPAQYGFHTAGIVDIQTKSGAFNNGGDISIYGGSHGEINPSLSYGGSAPGGINYFVTSSYLEDDLGIENPTNGTSAIHNQTQQGKMFAYVSKVIDDTSRVSVMLSASHSDFQIPNSPGGTDYFTASGITNPGFPIIPSQDVNDRQIEQNFYGIVTYQKAEDKLNIQASAFTRFSEVQYLPDNIGDLDYNGVATTVNDSILTNGLEMDGSYELNDTNTLRAGSTFSISDAINDNNTLAFPVDPNGNPTTAIPTSIIDNNQKQGEQYGLYLQDEWKVTEPLTINYGGRFDQSYQYLNEYQFSPRVNAVYEVDGATKVHGGYARYFTPPPLELEQGGNPAIYNGTTAQLLTTQNSPIKAERSNYFDLGMTHDFSPELHTGIDGYYKLATQQLDEGQFGAAPIFVPFNYKEGKVDGVEFTTEYKKGGLSVYSNTALSSALGKDIDSAQYEDPTVGELDYISDHWIHLDHDQFITGSGGVAYEFDGSPYALLNKTKVSADILYGSGLRAGFANEEHTGFYNPVNIGIEHTVHLPNFP